MFKWQAGWAYLYRAVDSVGETIEFMLSAQTRPAAKLVLRHALSGGGPRTGVINVGHPAYASAVA
jgi:transposase-like protein